MPYCDVDLMETEQFENVNILGHFVILPYMVIFIKSTVINKLLLKLLFIKLLWTCLMHVWKATIMEIERV